MTASLRMLRHCGISTWPEQPGACPRGLHRSFRPQWYSLTSIRTSSAYVFTDPAASKSKSHAGTKSDIKSIHGQLLSSGSQGIQPTMLNRPNRRVMTLCHNCTLRFDARFYMAIQRSTTQRVVQQR